MLTGIRIDNYRGIRQGRVDDLGSVNLFLGPNGSGKSTVLEAIFLGAYNTSAFHFNGASFNTVIIPGRHNEDNFPTVDCWYRKDSSSPIKICYSFGNQVDVFSIVGERGSARAAWQTKIPDSRSSFYSSMRFLDVKILLDRGVEKQGWDQLLNVRGDRELIRVVNQVYNLQLETFSFTAQRQVLKALFTDRDYALNIDDLSAGMRIAFRLFVSILLSPETAVLVEEFDGYQHIQSMDQFVNVLFNLAARAKTQLFLATHNLETVKVFVREAVKLASNAQASQARLRIFQTTLAHDGTFQAAGLSADEADGLLAGGFDIRKTN